MSNDDKLSRREFLWRAGMIGAVAAGGSQFLAACEKSGGEKSGGAGSEKTGGGKEAAKADKGGGEFSCTDTSGLSESAIKMREQQEYVDQSPKEDQNCLNCQLYQPAEKEGTCGGCASLKGPIHPKGYCNLWVKKAS
jgi:hypothetical protein